ncbi:MAG: ABC transporter permease [Brevinematales bacterium]
MHYLISFSMKNVLRNKRRTFLTLMGIILAVSAMIIGSSILSGALNQVLDASIKSSGNICIQTKAFTRSERLLPTDRGLEDIEGLVEDLKKYPEIDRVIPNVKFAGLFVTNDENFASMGISIIPEAEKDIIRLQDNLVAGTYFTGGSNEAVIGVEIARKLGFKAGDQALFVTRNSYDSLAAKKFRIVGIADFNMYEQNRTFYAGLDTVYSLLKINGRPQKAMIILRNSSDMDRVKALLVKDTYIKEHNLDVFKADEIGLFSTIFLLIPWIARFIMALFLLSAGMTIVNTMMMTVLERTAEIGVLQSMGMKRGAAVAMIVIESTFIGLIGSAAGAAIGGPVAFYYAKNGIILGENIARGMPIAIKNVIYPETGFGTIALIMAIGIIMAAAAGAIPAFLKILRLNPSQAIRSE